MLKNILKLDGAQSLSKNEQKSIQGGGPFTSLCLDHCAGGAPCASGESCVLFNCHGIGPIHGVCIGDGGTK